MTSTESAPVVSGAHVSAWDVSPMDNIVISTNIHSDVLYVTRIEIIAERYEFSGISLATRTRYSLSARRDDVVWIVWERGMGEE